MTTGGPLQEKKMQSEESARLYADLGVRPVINAAGAYTVLGGSALSPAVRQAMDKANFYFVEMRELLASSGRTIAGMLGCEAAYVTSGAGGALVLASAACMTGMDREKIERLPDTAGIKNEILIQKSRRITYDRCVTIPGARLVEVGGEGGTTEAQLEAGFSDRTCAVHFLAPGSPDSLPIEAVVRIAHAHGVPVIVDAAGLTYPLDNLRRYTRAGADLVCYAGKYFDAPHSTGLLLGKRDLVEAASMNGFVSFETNGLRTIGRAMKIDRQEIVAAVVALREWLTMNHEERLLRYGARAEVILRALAGLPDVEARRISELETPAPVVREGVRISLRDGARKTARQVEAELREGTPCIWARAVDSVLNLSVAFFNDGEEQVVADRLKAILTA